LSLRGPRWALWALRFIWIWCAIGLVGTILVRGIPMLGAAMGRDPEALGGIGGIILLAAVLWWSYRPLWPPSPSVTKDA